MCLVKVFNVKTEKLDVLDGLVRNTRVVASFRELNGSSALKALN